VQTLRKAQHVEAVYDVTVAYAKISATGDPVFQSPPTFAETLSMPKLNEQWRFFVHVERHPLDELPRTDQDLAQWLEDRWVEKGERLEELRQRLSKGLPW